MTGTRTWCRQHPWKNLTNMLCLDMFGIYGYAVKLWLCVFSGIVCWRTFRGVRCPAIDLSFWWNVTGLLENWPFKITQVWPSLPCQRTGRWGQSEPNWGSQIVNYGFLTRGGGRCWNVRRQPAKLREIWCPPPVTSWFTLPLTIDIIPVNPSDWSYVHELSKLWGTTQHEQNSQEAGSIQVSPDLVETTSPYCSSMMIVKFSMCFCSRVICHHVISWTGWLCVRLISSGITHTPQSRKYRI
jgi:hypothetical protein